MGRRCSVSASDDLLMTDLTKDIQRLQRKAERERAARKAAEQLLNVKSLELYDALELGKKDRNKLELAIWAGNESIWDWNADEQIYELMSYPSGASEVVRTWGNTAQVVKRIHPDDRQEFITNWQLFLSDMLDSFDLLLRYRLPRDPNRTQSKEDALAQRENHELQLTAPRQRTRTDDLQASHSPTAASRAYSPQPDTAQPDTTQPDPQQWRWLHWRGRIVERDKQGTPTRAVGTVKDITNYRRTQESYRLMARAFASSRDAMVITDQHGHIQEANQGFQDLFKLTPARYHGRSLDEFVDMVDVAKRTLNEHGSISFETSSTQATNGNPNTDSETDTGIPLEVSLNHFQPDDASHFYSIITLRDLSERNKAQQALEHMASHDGLTNLPNRGTLHEQLERMLGSASEQRPLAVMFVDLDGFKAVNDEFGHIAADLLLVSQARRLKRITPKDGLVARWGGDEFVVAWWPERRPIDADPIPSAVLKTIREPMGLHGASIRLSASIGIVETTDAEVGATQLIREADTAMYEAKAQGRNRIQVFCKGMGKAALHRASLVSELAQAIEQDQISFHVQPKFDQNQRIVGGEMLARWTSQSSGFVSPAEFIPMIEQNGLNAAFAEAVMRNGCRYARQIVAVDPAAHLAINLSGWQLLDTSLPEKLKTHCSNEQVDCKALELEITESVFLQPDSDPVSIMNRLRKKGFRIAIDDFGTGYSSLSYLRDMPLDTVKIDRSFVIDADANERAHKILSAIITMSHQLDMKVVAEGVETDGQWQLLRDLDVEIYQGFLFGRPMPFDDFLQLLKQQSSLKSEV